MKLVERKLPKPQKAVDRMVTFGNVSFKPGPKAVQGSVPKLSGKKAIDNLLKAVNPENFRAVV